MRGKALVVLLLLSGCAKDPPSLPAGTKIGNLDGFWSRMLPAYHPGMRWSYRKVLVGSGTLTTDRVTLEVTEVTGNLASLKVSGWVEPATVSVQAPTEAIFSPTASYESLGTEDVTVPYGSFKKAAKFKYDPRYSAQGEETETLLWFVQGIGLVKTADIRGSKNTVVTEELTEYKK